MRVLLALLLLLPPALAHAGGARFYFSGDGVLEMDHAHLGETLAVRYRDADGRYDPAALARIEHFFRSRSDGERGPISLRLIELLDFVADRSGAARPTLVSAYRSPELNRDLRDGGRRVAQASLHTEGLAADVAFAGADLRRLWLDLRRLGVGGVGLYRSDGFLHLDTGRPRFWEPSTAGVEQNLSAGNARLFARTDYDRYRDLEGAVISLHSLTALPVRVGREARLGNERLPLLPRGADLALEGDCWVLEEPAAAYQFVVAAPAAAPARRAPIVVSLCGARELATNEVERSGQPTAP